MKEFALAILSDIEDDMMCAECEELLPDYINAKIVGLAALPNEQEIEHHLLLCPVCAESYAELVELTAPFYGVDPVELQLHYTGSFLPPPVPPSEKLSIFEKILHTVSDITGRMTAHLWPIGMFSAMSVGAVILLWIMMMPEDSMELGPAGAMQSAVIQEIEADHIRATVQQQEVLAASIDMGTIANSVGGRELTPLSQAAVLERVTLDDELGSNSAAKEDAEVLLAGNIPLPNWLKSIQSPEQNILTPVRVLEGHHLAAAEAGHALTILSWEDTQINESSPSYLLLLNDTSISSLTASLQSLINDQEPSATNAYLSTLESDAESDISTSAPAAQDDSLMSETDVLVRTGEDVEVTVIYPRSDDPPSSSPSSLTTSPSQSCTYSYTTRNGDTISSIADQFVSTSTTITNCVENTRTLAQNGSIILVPSSRYKRIEPQSTSLVPPAPPARRPRDRNNGSSASIGSTATITQSTAATSYDPRLSRDQALEKQSGHNVYAPIIIISPQATTDAVQR